MRQSRLWTCWWAPRAWPCAAAESSKVWRKNNVFCNYIQFCLGLLLRSFLHQNVIPHVEVSSVVSTSDFRIVQSQHCPCLHLAQGIAVVVALGSPAPFMAIALHFPIDSATSNIFADELEQLLSLAFRRPSPTQTRSANGTTHSNFALTGTRGAAGR